MRRRDVGLVLAALLVSRGARAATYATRGVVRSFGKERAYVNIEHEAIPGFMEAMTMSFHPRRPEQITQLAAGDRVRFTFTEADGFRRLIDSIEKLG